MMKVGCQSFSSTVFKIHDSQAGQRTGAEAVFLFVLASFFFECTGQPGSVVHPIAGFGVFDDRFTDRQALKCRRQIRQVTASAQLIRRI